MEKFIAYQLQNYIPDSLTRRSIPPSELPLAVGDVDGYIEYLEPTQPVTRYEVPVPPGRPPKTIILFPYPSMLPSDFADLLPKPPKQRVLFRSPGPLSPGLPPESVKSKHLVPLFEQHNKSSRKPSANASTLFLAIEALSFLITACNPAGTAEQIQAYEEPAIYPDEEDPNEQIPQWAIDGNTDFGQLLALGLVSGLAASPESGTARYEQWARSILYQLNIHNYSDPLSPGSQGKGATADTQTVNTKLHREILEMVRSRPKDGISYQVFQFKTPTTQGLITVVNHGKQAVGFDFVERDLRSKEYSSQVYMDPSYRNAGHFSRAHALSLRALASLSRNGFIVNVFALPSKFYQQVKATYESFGYKFGGAMTSARFGTLNVTGKMAAVLRKIQVGSFRYGKVWTERLDEYSRIERVRIILTRSPPADAGGRSQPPDKGGGKAPYQGKDPPQIPPAPK